MPAITAPARNPARPHLPKRLLALASDERLVEQIRRGNEQAFVVAFERHSGPILSFCRHMLGSREEAEDALQHTFAAAYRSLLEDDRAIQLKPWLYAIARNRCLSVIRARREQVAEDLELETAGLQEQVLERAELRELLRDLHDLPEEQREALLLAELGDLSHAQIAAILGCEVPRVKAVVFRARAGLMERREAREMPCTEVREQLANLRGGSLRRSEIRHHLRICEGCREFRGEVRRQRQLLAAVLPVIPSAGLKGGVLGAILGTGGGSAGGGLAAGAASSVAAKLAVAGVLVGGGAVVGTVALDRGAADPERHATPAAPPAAAASQGDSARSAAGATPVGRAVRAHRIGRRSSRRRRAAHRHHRHGRSTPNRLQAVLAPAANPHSKPGARRGQAPTAHVKKPKKAKKVIWSAPPRARSHTRPPKAQGPPAVAPPASEPVDGGHGQTRTEKLGTDRRAG
jgi:RNA polymerase sigma factor (sigma-70 family)